MGLTVLAFTAAALAANPVPAATTANVAARLAAPPDEARAMVRWWWFGPSVTKPE
jgi:hypothetical protein